MEYFACDYIFYRVQKGECLYSISQKFSLTPKIIILDNNLTCEPNACDLILIRKTPFKIYTVKAGDSLESLVCRFGGDILRLNGIDYVYPSLRLIIPK